MWGALMQTLAVHAFQSQSNVFYIFQVVGDFDFLPAYIYLLSAKTKAISAVNFAVQSFSISLQLVNIHKQQTLLKSTTQNATNFNKFIF